MQFPTLTFALFFLLVWPVSWLTRRSRLAQKVFLLAASYVFYAWLDWRMGLLLAASSAVNWAFGEWIAEASSRANQTLAVWTAIAINLGTLGFFKYYGFFQESLDGFLGVVGLSSGLPVLEVLLPLGISFYTFQSITYVVDLYRGYGERARHLLDYALYIAFFPQLLIGPIVRSRDFLPQLLGEAPNKVPNVSLAGSLIASGLFKKVVLATFLQTHLVDDAFVAPENYTSPALMAAAYAYTIQIYLDFSGYTDMARGLGLLLGFHLPENFNQPYRSTSIAEFWRRWHITFSNWLRDYIYLPLGGSRRAPWRVYANLMATLLVGGFWHGAHWKFLIWGGIHGAALVGYKMVQDRRRALGIDPKTLVHPWWWLLLGWLYTFHLVVFARIVFRTADLDVAWLFGTQLLTGGLVGTGVEWMVLVVVSVGLALNFWGQHLRKAFLDLHERTPWGLRPVLWAALAVVFLALRPDDVAPFIYFQF